MWNHIEAAHSARASVAVAVQVRLLRLVCPVALRHGAADQHFQIFGRRHCAEDFEWPKLTVSRLCAFDFRDSTSRVEDGIREPVDPCERPRLALMSFAFLLIHDDAHAVFLQALHLHRASCFQQIQTGPLVVDSPSGQQLVVSAPPGFSCPCCCQAPVFNASTSTYTMSSTLFSADVTNRVQFHPTLSVLQLWLLQFRGVVHMLSLLHPRGWFLRFLLLAVSTEE